MPYAMVRGGLLIAVLVGAMLPAAADSRTALLEGSFGIDAALRGVHPRLLVGPDGMARLAERYASSPQDFTPFLSSAPKPQSVIAGDLQDKENAYYALTIAQLAVAWRVTGRSEYRAALESWIPVLQRFEPIRIDPKNPSSGNRDLSCGSLLTGMALAYDALCGSLQGEEEAVFRKVLVAQAEAAYEDILAYKFYHYEQNHLIVPVCGLGLAAMATCDELPEAAAWGTFAGNLLARSFAALANDGWFFEGISYWSFTMQYTTVYAAALLRTTGTDLFGASPFRYIPEYLEHMFLPDKRFAFDFADWGPRINEDGTHQRGWEEPWHSLGTNINLMIPAAMNLAHPDSRLSEFLSARAPSRGSGTSAMDRIFFTLVPFKVAAAAPAGAPRSDPPYHYFPDMDVVHWRSAWNDPNATAIAFKSGPPAGHAIAKLYPLYPEWRPGLGHAHPDNGSFLLFSGGAFLAGDTGYAVKRTQYHNTIAVDGAGQGHDGTAWATFDGMPYDRLNGTRLEAAWLGPSIMASRAVFQDCYDPRLEIRRMERRIVLVAGRFLVVSDLMSSDREHRYSWFLHSDRAALPAQGGGWTIANGRSLLVLRSLLPAEIHAPEPTMVDAQIYSGPPVLQQRGYQLEMSSPQARDFSFLVAMDIQSEGTASDFTASLGFLDPATKAAQVDLADGGLSCSIFLGDQSRMTGDYGFILFDEGRVVKAGLRGERLKIGSRTLSLPGGGSAVLDFDAAGKVQAEAGTDPSWRLE